MSIKTFPNVNPDAGPQWGLESNTTSFTSNLNGTEQIQALPGAKWYGSYTFSNRTDRLVSSFIMSLEGSSGEFYLSPPDLDQKGSQGGTGLVNGALQSGNSIITDGWTANQTNLFEIGDYFEVNGELKMVTSVASSDGTGQSTIEFTPKLRRSPPDNASILTSNPRAVFRLSEDNPSFQVNVNGVSTVGFSFVEKF